MSQKYKRSEEKKQVKDKSKTKCFKKDKKKKTKLLTRRRPLIKIDKRKPLFI